MNRTPYKVTIDLSVHSANALFLAAGAHDDCADPGDLMHDDGSIDVAACLLMLLDPGHLAGCTVTHSEACEVQS